MFKSLIVSAGLLAFALATPAVATPVPWLPLENARSERVADPVFGGEMVVYEVGPADAETVVLIHGIGDGGARDWRGLIMALAADYRVLAVDMPGFAASSRGNHLYAPEQLAIAVHKAIAPRAGQNYSLIGHSLGAAVSLAYAHIYSDEMRRLILVDAPGLLHRYVYTKFLSTQGAAMLDAMVPQGGEWIAGLISSQMARMEAQGFNPALLLHSPWARQQLFGGDPKLISAYAVAQHDFSAALRDLRLPTLVLWGEQDPLAPLRSGQLAAAVIPGARLRVFAGVGHVPMAQAPKEFNATIRDELAGRLDSLPAYAHPAKAPENGRSLRCENQHGAHFSGPIERLELVNCSNVKVEDANINHVQIQGGSVHIVNSHVFKGITAGDSRLQLTAGSVRGEPPLTLSNSNVDAAGTHFYADYDIAKNSGATPLRLAFSVSVQHDHGGHKRPLHEVVSVPAQGIWP